MTPHQYLMDEHAHSFYPTLAERLGLSEAIVLQQIHSWIQTYTKDPKQYQEQHWHNGAWWIWNSYPDWHEALPYLSESTIARTLKGLRDLGIVKTANYNKLKIDRTLWYTIDYDAYDKLWQDQDAKTDAPSYQNDRMEDANLAGPLPSFSPDLSSDKNPPDGDCSPGDDSPPPNPAQQRLERMRQRMGSNPLTVAAKSKAQRDKLKHPDWTDAAHDVDAWANGPLEGFKALAHRTDLKTSELKNWPRKLQEWAADWNATPDETYQAIRSIPDSEHGWQTFKTPYDTGFLTAMDAMIDRLRNGQPINAKGATPTNGVREARAPTGSDMVVM